MEHRLFALQRLSAMVMAPFVFVHLGLIVYAVRGGLSAAEILARTQGSLAWIGFYTLFVLSVSVHVPIGVRNILIEWLHLGRQRATLASLVLGVVLLALG
ncbi:MAG TPA: succinate dehydrogenase, partial [Ramlibacter sp.]|nr:succinate dehydrogenase [Ramlibacter sp.]